MKKLLLSIIIIIIFFVSILYLGLTDGFEKIIGVIGINTMRLIWFSMGILGYFIFYKTRKTFYLKMGKLELAIAVIVYGLLGPMTFALALVRLINQESFNKD